MFRWSISKYQNEYLTKRTTKMARLHDVLQKMSTTVVVIKGGFWRSLCSAKNYLDFKATQELYLEN